MKDQYRKETSQIHAPADLIQKTKQAMVQEEQRLSKKQRSFARQIYKWALPLTAAAAVLILLSVSTVMRSVKPDSSASGMMAESEYEKDMGMQLSEADIAKEAAEEDAMLIDESPAGPDRNDMAQDYAMADAAEDAAYPEEMNPVQNTESAMLEESAASEKSAASEESETGAGYQDMEAKKDKAEPADGRNREEAAGQESAIEITGVEEEPDFYDSPDTESYLYRNLLFWLIQEDEGWTAYVSVRGDKYVISGAIADREEFLEQAYELLVETRGASG